MVCCLSLMSLETEIHRCNVQAGWKTPSDQQDGAAGDSVSSAEPARSGSDSPWWQQHVSSSAGSDRGTNGYASSAAGQPTRSNNGASAQRCGPSVATFATSVCVSAALLCTTAIRASSGN